MYKIMNGMDKGTQSYTEDEVYEMLKQDVIYHDWSYMMSDDHRVWGVGLNVEKCIKEMLHILIGVCKMDAEALYSEVKGLAGNDYTDYDSKGNGLKYRTINGWFKPYIEVGSIS
jgi:hypothetical protein